MNEHWHIDPYARAGGSLASAEFDGSLYGLGTRSTSEWEPRGVHARMLNDVLFAGVIYEDPTSPNDILVRLRNGLELRRLSGPKIKQHGIELSVYGFADYFPDAPRPPVAGTRARRLQIEPGNIARRRAAVEDVPLPRIGLGYRFAGDLSGWHLDISEPF